VYPPYFFRELNREKLFQKVPAEHARWIGRLLSRLTKAQLRSAFAAAGYSRPATDILVGALEERIRILATLPLNGQVAQNR
jgi:hypothetical protein